MNQKTTSSRLGFTIVPNALFDDDALDGKEKIVLLSIMSFADWHTHQAFPSHAKIACSAGFCIKTIERACKSLETKGYLQIEKRHQADGGQTSNLYTLTGPTLVYLEGLNLNQKTAPSTINDHSCESQVNMPLHNETYSLANLHLHFNYEIITQDLSDYKDLIDYVFLIIYETINSNDCSFRIHNQDMAKSIVTSQLLKLNYEEIEFVIKKYKSIDYHIENTYGFILTQLYEAKGQYTAETINKVNCDFNTVCPEKNSIN